jgi:hypothetical protein
MQNHTWTGEDMVALIKDTEERVAKLEAQGGKDLSISLTNLLAVKARSAVRTKLAATGRPVHTVG